MTKMFGPIWEGVYSSFAEIADPEESDAFQTNRWLLQCHKRLEDSQSGEPIQDARAQLLPALAAVASNTGRLRVFDLGGGLGADYHYVLRALIPGTVCDYVIMEKPAVCEVGKSLTDDIQFISQIDELGDVDQAFHVLYAGSSITYIPDWDTFLPSLLARTKPLFVIMTDVPAGDIQTYVTAQNYYGRRIATWMFNKADIDDVMSHASYEPVTVGRCVCMDQCNLPRERQLEVTLNLFYRKTAGATRGG